MTAIFCSCREPAKLEQSSLPTLIEKNECFFSLNSLLFCKACNSIRCSYCSVSEPISWYCSQCLQETTKSGAREAFNKCLRNCLRCPKCKSNAICRTGKEETVSVQCSNCDYSYRMQKLPNTTLGAQVMKLNLHEFSKVCGTIDQSLLNSNKSRPSFKSETPSSSHDQLPELASLRAKYSKLCGACGSHLAIPSKHPTQVKLDHKSLARDFLPEIELRYNENQCYLIASSHSSDEMIVSIANLDADVLVPSDLKIPSSASEGFGAPLFLVFRESLESRQAFMTGKKDAKSGPGWAMGEASVPSGVNSILLYISVSKGSGPPIGAWMRASVRSS